MFCKCVFLMWALSAMCGAAPSSYVNFVRHHGTTIPATRTESARNTRSFTFPLELYDPFEELWNDNHLLIVPDDKFFHLENIASTRDHITPDFSDGLAFPDPLLLTGATAKLAVRHLYRKELFFEEIPHLRAVSYNQRQRRENGLPGNVLGSLRPTWPIYRFARRFSF